ncbi:hypothetical protein K432DRAFT_290686 [Lepidopterella palustris CBS 459.81]|uniref:DUF7598 domain-containing protein n=1 Tax=Lepidopterella palustris CBS 459.81 TaxID=1314670 RepID=A0A8E2JIT1_9PEZI|nr:hypothetical protein K432DRAFT_290686 [Lepidopterella palustris CBS 459.81]
MALLSTKSLAGPGYIILNILRAMNIIALMAVVAASVVMLVKTFIVSRFFFFDAVSHVITALSSTFLMVSECSLFRTYFARNWPLLSPSHGFVGLGVGMIILGLNILGNMNKAATSQESLGLAFWRLVLASGILVLVIGFFNVFASYIFRDTSQGITARRVRSHGAVALTSQEEGAPKALSINTHSTGSSSMQQSTFSPVKSSPRKSFSPARTFRHARQSLLPSYHSSSPLRVFHTSSASDGSSTSKKSKRSSIGPRVPINISAPLNVNPQFAHLVRPDLAHHPSQRKPEEMGLGL